MVGGRDAPPGVAAMLTPLLRAAWRRDCVRREPGRSGPDGARRLGIRRRERSRPRLPVARSVSIRSRLRCVRHGDLGGARPPPRRRRRHPQCHRAGSDIAFTLGRALAAAEGVAVPGSPRASTAPPTGAVLRGHRDGSRRQGRRQRAPSSVPRPARGCGGRSESTASCCRSGRRARRREVLFPLRNRILAHSPRSSWSSRTTSTVVR